MEKYFLHLFQLVLVTTVSLSCSHQIARSPQEEQIPLVSFSLTPVKMDQLFFRTLGRIYPCVKTNESATILLPSNADIKISQGGVGLQANSKNEITINCENRNLELTYDGTVTLKQGMCEAIGEEIYCRPKSYPNPEVYADRLRYNISFNLPSGITALTPDTSLSLNNGILFQLAKFKPAVVHRTPHFFIEYIFPEDFNADTKNFQFAEKTLETYYENFGSLAFDHIRVGAIRRGEKTGEISGSPGGNLILFSRTAFGDPANLKGLERMGITRDISDALRKMIIAHELSHFWFSDLYLGHDGWMIEGIPNYLGLIAVKKNLPDDFPELVKMFVFADKQGKQSPIPNRPFGEGDDYIKAYYQGPLALYRIGEAIGHDELIHFIANIYRQNSDPSFKEFESLFLSRFPEHVSVWRQAWRIQD